jgi:ATP-dependent DNA helicase DinG
LPVPNHVETIRDARVQLTKAIFQRPANPYGCCLLEPFEQKVLTALFQDLQRQEPQRQDRQHSDRVNEPIALPTTWSNFRDAFQLDDRLLWAEISRRQGQFSLHCGPLEVATDLAPLWTQQSVILIGGALDSRC